MKQTGKIIIKDSKVIFEYEDKELKCLNGVSGKAEYFEPIKKLVEVSNAFTTPSSLTKRKCYIVIDEWTCGTVENNKLCKAEVTDKAIITKIL